MTIEKIRSDDLGRYIDSARPVNASGQAPEPIRRSTRGSKKIGVKQIQWKTAREQYAYICENAEAIRIEFDASEANDAALFVRGLRKMRPSFALALCPEGVGHADEEYILKMAGYCSAFTAIAYSRSRSFTIMLAPLTQRVAELFETDRVLNTINARRKCA